MKEIIVATDGSALDNPNGAAGWAWFVDEDRWDFGAIPKGSNQLAEALALYRALVSLPRDIPLRVQMDSLFWINVLGEDGRGGWRAGWKRRGWIKADGKAPANLKILKEMDKVILSRKAPLVLEWVKGHRDHILNNVADKLCTHASFMIRQGSTVKGPGWRPRSHSTLYPYELPPEARKILDRAVDPTPGKVRTSKLSKTEVAKRKKEAESKSPAKVAAAAKDKSAVTKPAGSPSKPSTSTKTTTSTTKASTPAKKAPVASSSVMRPSRKSASPQLSKPAYKAAVLNPPTATQRAKAEAAAKRAAAAKKAKSSIQKTPKKNPSVPDRSIGSFWDDDDNGLELIGENRKKNVQFCTACDGPINPATQECRCSN